MTPERWQRLEPILAAALERPAAEQESFVAGAAAGDATLLEELQSERRRMHPKRVRFCSRSHSITPRRNNCRAKLSPRPAIFTRSDCCCTNC